MEDNNKEIAQRAAELLAYETKYIPGETEGTDMFEVRCEFLELTNYGPTKEAALRNAKINATEELLTRITDARQILKNWISDQENKKKSKTVS